MCPLFIFPNVLYLFFWCIWIAKFLNLKMNQIFFSDFYMKLKFIPQMLLMFYGILNELLQVYDSVSNSYTLQKIISIPHTLLVLLKGNICPFSGLHGNIQTLKNHTSAPHNAEHTACNSY